MGKATPREENNFSQSATRRGVHFIRAADLSELPEL